MSTPPRRPARSPAFTRSALAAARGETERPPSPLTATTSCPDPATVFDRLWREHGPVAPVELAPGVPAWLVMGYRELLEVTWQEHLFTRDPGGWRALRDGRVPPDSPLGPMMFFRDNVTGHDGEEHRRLRRPLEAAIAAIDHRRLRRTVRTRCADLIGGFAAQGSADLVGDYAAAVPLLTMGDLIGLEPDQSRALPAAVRLLFSSGQDARAGDRRFTELLAGLLAARRAAPAEDLATLLLAHRDLRTGDEVLQSLIALVANGNHTTMSWIAQSLRLMLIDRRLADGVHGGRLGIDEALNVVLARQPPIVNMPARYALRDTDLADRRIRAGDALILGLAAASRDPRAHARADDVEGGNRAHLAWGAGPHACPARDPAYTIASTAVETALAMLHRVRLTIDPGDVRFEPSPWTHCPAALPVAFDSVLPMPPDHTAPTARAAPTVTAGPPVGRPPAGDDSARWRSP